MYDVIMGLGTNVHILWCVGLLGLLLKMCVNFHMKSMIKASENMATTKKKSLRIMRQKYVNGRNLGINRGNGAAFVEKNIRRQIIIYQQQYQCFACVVLLEKLTE